MGVNRYIRIYADIIPLPQKKKAAVQQTFAFSRHGTYIFIHKNICSIIRRFRRLAVLTDISAFMRILYHSRGKKKAVKEQIFTLLQMTFIFWRQKYKQYVRCLTAAIGCNRHPDA